MGKITTKELIEKVGTLSVRVSLYRLVILGLAITVAGFVALPALADYIQAGGQAPKIGNVEVYNEADQPVIAPLPEGDLEAGGKQLYVPQDFLIGFEVRGDEYLDKYGLWARTTVELDLDFSPTTTDAYQLLFTYNNTLANNESLLIKDFWIDMITSLNSYGGTINCGTTTAATSTPAAGLNSTTSATYLAVKYLASGFDSASAAGGLISLGNATSSNNFGSFFTVRNDFVTNGNFTTTTWEIFLKTDEAFTCTLLPDLSASSSDLAIKGNNTGVGKAHFEIFHRND